MANTLQVVLRKINNETEKEIILIIKKDVPKMVEDYLRKSIDNQVDAEGKKFPTKKPATKLAYEKKGWDKVHWLVASGKSTNYPSLKLKVTKTTKGIKLNPKDPNGILKYVEQNDTWFMLNDEIQNKILAYIEDKLAEFCMRKYS